MKVSRNFPAGNCMRRGHDSSDVTIFVREGRVRKKKTAKGQTELRCRAARSAISSRKRIECLKRQQWRRHTTETKTKVATRDNNNWFATTRSHAPGLKAQRLTRRQLNECSASLDTTPPDVGSRKLPPTTKAPPPSCNSNEECCRQSSTDYIFHTDCYDCMSAPRHNRSFGSRAIRIPVVPRTWNTSSASIPFVTASQSLLIEDTRRFITFSLFLSPLYGDPAAMHPDSYPRMALYVSFTYLLIYDKLLC